MKPGDVVRVPSGKTGPVIELLPYERVSVELTLYPGTETPLPVVCPVIFLIEDVEVIQTG